MIRTIAFCVLLGLSAVRAEEKEDGDERLGYYSITSGGASSLSFNATSIQNAVILGLLMLVLGYLILPLFGITLPSFEEETAAGYASEAAYGQAYSNFAKRTGMDFMSPVLAALQKGKKKYEEEE